MSLFKAANSPSPSSPPEDRGSIAPQGSNVPTTGARRQRASQSGYQPLSDTDVSTTHHEMLPGWNGERIDVIKLVILTSFIVFECLTLYFFNRCLSWPQWVLASMGMTLIVVHLIQSRIHLREWL